MKEMQDDIVLVQDADLGYDPHEIPQVIHPSLDGKVISFVLETKRSTTYLSDFQRDSLFTHGVTPERPISI